MLYSRRLRRAILKRSESYETILIRFSSQSPHPRPAAPDEDANRWTEIFVGPCKPLCVDRNIPYRRSPPIKLSDLSQLPFLGSGLSGAGSASASQSPPHQTLGVIRGGPCNKEPGNSGIQAGRHRSGALIYRAPLHESCVHPGRCGTRLACFSDGLALSGHGTLSLGLSQVCR